MINIILDKLLKSDIVLAAPLARLPSHPILIENLRRQILDFVFAQIDADASQQIGQLYERNDMGYFSGLVRVFALVQYLSVVEHVLHLAVEPAGGAAVEEG